MASRREAARIRTFVWAQLREEPDLSTLTLGILKRRYLAQVKCESLSSDTRHFMKQVVEEELMKMQDNDKNGSELETKKPQTKRKRDEENDEISERGDESRAKKLRSNHSSSSSESEGKEDCKTGSEESEDDDKPQSDAEQEVRNSERNESHEQQGKSDDSPDEDMDESDKKGNESSSDDSPEGVGKKNAKVTKNGETTSSRTSKGKKTPDSDGENESDASSKSERSDKISGNESSDGSEKDDKVLEEKENNEPDSDSSSLPSMEDEQDSRTKNTQDKKKKTGTVKKDEGTKGQKDGDKAVVRLKRYIALCGVKKNYKKLLDGCHSIRSKVVVLKKELEDLGVVGQPSIKKCKKVRMKREKAQELAALDVSNIITTQGRPKRRGASTWQNQRDSPAAAYQRSLNSGSDSDRDDDTHRGHRRVTEWANLRGIISDDADSD